MTLRLPGRIVTRGAVIPGTLALGPVIEAIEAQPDQACRDIILPGFIDLQVNGGAGVDVQSATPDALRTMTRFTASVGTTSLCPTIITSTDDARAAALAAIAEAMAGEAQGSSILGAHLEGPLLSHAKLGTHPSLATPAIDRLIADIETGPIAILTLAVEQPGARDVALAAQAAGVRVQCGHSDASYDQCMVARDWGVRSYTHLFNAMSALDHREPGVAGAALAHAEFASIIADFHHVHPAVIDIARRAIPKLFCVSDATAATGMPDGDHMLGSVPIVKKDGVLRNRDGALAGADLTMLDSFRNLITLGCDLIEAAARTSTYPADYLGLDDRGEIMAGRRGDIVVLTEDLSLKAVYIEGIGIRIG